MSCPAMSEETTIGANDSWAEVSLEMKPFLKTSGTEEVKPDSILGTAENNEATLDIPPTLLQRIQGALTSGKYLSTYKNEQKKSVCSNSKSSALWRFIFFHLPAVAVTMFLVVLYVKQQKWSPSHPSAEQLSALQFAAKAHESLILISLTEIIFHKIRYGLLTSDGIPLGFLTSAFHLASPIQYIFSWEFWGAALNPTTKRTSHVTTVVGIFVLALIGLGAGPFSAIVMIPRLMWWEIPPNHIPHDASVFYITNESYEKAINPAKGYLASKEYCKGESENDCLFANLDQLFDDMGPVLRSPPRTPQTKNVSFRAHGPVPRYRPITLSTSNQDYAFATSPMAFVAEVLYQDATYIDSMRNGSVMIRSLRRHLSEHLTEKWTQPLVAVRCAHTNELILPNTTMASFEFNDPEAADPLNVTFNLDDGLRYIKNRWNENMSTFDFHPVFLNAHKIPVPISAAILFPENYAIRNRNISKSANVQLCLVLSQWLTSNIWVTPQMTSIVQTELDIPSDKIIRHLHQMPTTQSTINMSREWLTGTSDRHNATYTEFSNPFYSRIFNNCSTLFQDEAGTCLPLVLASYFTDMLSNIKQLQEYDAKTSRGTPPGLEDVIIRRFFYILQYAYSPQHSTSIPMGFAVLLLHIWMVVLHAAFTVLSPDSWHSGAWGSIGELVTLALRSRAPHGLENVGGGVSSSETWKVVVKVREVGAERLEMVTSCPAKLQTRNETDVSEENTLGAAQVKPDMVYS
ncbi:hypothetical protein B0J13DRAFT_564812 [Dactylonectria estremocensis]|uniref:Uncharacterized protein n=1 Tax=Dactylonectria estremocensis TaxID=1079267 RepID=A0A9P9IPA4_9HYPO|nr:hypothetical protein B0J13DRAFT_564812 [Dactylonectria estremocensis]